jgi:predicted enzyme related to lactoylglutathione lyase
MPDRYLPGVPCWIELLAPEPDAAASFYGELLGWTVADGVARLDGRAVAGIRQGYGAVWTTAIRVDDAAALTARALAAGGHEVPGGLADPAGAHFALREQAGAELVNVPGTWNWSNLETSHVADAEAFYGAVFGWESMALGEGVRMFRLPGYGDRLAELDPSLRERHAQPGVPPGFSDAVAWLVPGEPARWSVTFAVDDVDGVAERCAVLGGEVVVAPYDEEGARLAVLRDAAGADLTVSHWGGA